MVLAGLGAGLTLGALAIGMTVGTSRSTVPVPSAPALAATTGSADQPTVAATGQTSPTVAAPRSSPVTEQPVAKPPIPPGCMSEWYRWSESQRLDFVTELQHNPRLAPDVVTFLKTVIQDRSRGIVTRNNAANALVGQDAKDPALAALFQRMVEDPAEPEKWRDYALQFLATSIDWSNQRNLMQATIWHMATDGPGSIPGTALLHLHYLDERGVAPLPSGYGNQLAKELVRREADLPTRMTIAGIAGQRRLARLAPALRTLAEQAPEPALRRTALAALGQIGDPVDAAFVARFTADADPLIAAAAKGAARHLATPSEPSRTDAGSPQP